MQADRSRTVANTRVPAAMRAAAAAAETIAFWAAVVLPFLYVPLFAVGVTGFTEEVVLGLLLANVLALLLGARHEQQADAGRHGG